VRVHRITNILGILGVMGLMIGYGIITRDQLVVWSGDEQQVYTRAEHPQIFLVSSACAFVVGLLFLGGAFYTHFGLKLRRAPASGPWGLSWYAIIMVSLGLIGILAALIAGAFLH
jgi:hypothetical protein